MTQEERDFKQRIKEFENTYFSGSSMAHDQAASLRQQVAASKLSDRGKDKMCQQISNSENRVVKKFENRVVKKFNMASSETTFFQKYHLKLYIGAGVIISGAVALHAVAKENIAKEEPKESFVQDIVDFSQTASVVSSITSKQKPADSNVEEIVPPTAEEEVKAVLPSNLWFDPNDNEALMNQSIDFITSALPCGIDFSSEKDIGKFIDLYIVANIERIDPVDLARLDYGYKTTQSMIDNYQYCINQIASDLMTVTPETMLSYDFIANKDDRDILMRLQTLVAQNNATEDKKEKKELATSIETLLYDNFTLQDGRNEYSHVIYEIMGRFAKAADLTLSKKLPKELTKILCDDLNNCYEVKEDDKRKTERAQAETAVREMLDDKLAIAIEYRMQDMSMVSEMEMLTGVELEAKIYEQVQLSEQEYVPNPTFQYEGQGTSKSSKKKNTKEAVNLPNGESVAKDQVEGLGLDASTVTPEQYQDAMVKQFQDEAQKSQDHTIKDTSGNVVATGSEVDAAEYNRGYSDGYAVGNSYMPKSPSGSTSYCAGYEKGYAQGLADRQAIDANSNSTVNRFEPTQGQPSDTQTNIVENGYTSQVPPPHEHQFILNSEVQPTCTTDGYKLYICSTDGAEKREPIPALEHSTVEEIQQEGNAQTTTIRCDRCNGILDIKITTLEESSMESESTTTFVPVDGETLIEEDSTIVEEVFKTGLNSITSNILQLKAMRAMLNTQMINPTYNASTGMFTFHDEVYDVNQKTKRA